MSSETQRRKKTYQPSHQETWCEPNEWSTNYVDADGCLTVALDCGKHFTKAPQKAVLSGKFFTGCTLNHRQRPDNFDWMARQKEIGTSTQMSVKAGRQS